MRITASWSRSCGSTEYKYVAQCSAPVGERPSDRPKYKHAPPYTEQSELPRLALDGKIPIQVVDHRPAAPLLHRQPRLGAVERLDLALLVDREHDRVRRRIDVEPHAAAQLADELRGLRPL